MNRLLLLTSFLAFASKRAAATVYSPPSPLTFSSWVGASESWFSYPEAAGGSSYNLPSLTTKQNIGIAISGGGFRAATLGLGWLRALHMMNATGAARYLSSNSGGSWLNAAFSFQSKVPLSTFLGSYIPPQQLSAQQLQRKAAKGSFEGVVADASLVIPGSIDALSNAITSLAAGEQAGVGAWSAAVGQAFLAPYDLNSDVATFTAAGTAGPVHQAAKSLPDVYTYQPTGHHEAGSKDARPYPIIMGAIQLTESPLHSFPFEFTPLYVGCPAYFNDTTPPLGGGFTDPLGLNTPPPEPKRSIRDAILEAFQAGNSRGKVAGDVRSQPSDVGQDEVNHGQPLQVQSKPDFVVPLKMVAGISSSVLASIASPTDELSRQLTGTEMLRYWSPVHFRGKRMAFGDGAAIDNLAITPLLRRRVTKIIACVAADRAAGSSTAEEWAGHQWDVSGLFGATPLQSPKDWERRAMTGVTAELHNQKLQVFPSDGYQGLFDAVKRTTAAGGPTYHKATYSVMENRYQAITGGWQVEVLWVINQQQSAWEASLPKDVAAALGIGSRKGSTSGAAGIVADVLLSGVEDVLGPLTEAFGVAGSTNPLDLKHYPYISTADANYSPGLVKLLSQQATWQMLHLQPQLLQLLLGSSAATWEDQPLSG